MKIRKCFNFPGIITGITLGMLSIPSSFAADKVCANESISSGTYDNIIVKNDSSCELLKDVTVLKDVEASGAKDVTIHGSTVMGNVSIKQSKGTKILINNMAQINGNVQIKNNTITGDINIDGGNSRIAFGVKVGGDIEIINNSALGVIVYGVDIGGNLSVKHNNTVFRVHTDCDAINGNFMFTANTTTDPDGFMSALMDCPTIQNGPPGYVSGNAQLNSNKAAGRIDFSYIKTPGNIIINDNTSGPPQSLVSIATHTVGGNLICKNNNPLPNFCFFGDPPSQVSGQNLCEGSCPP